MSVAAQRRLRTAITDGRFDPVYYLHGDDDFRKQVAVTELVDAAADSATRDFNVDVVRGGDVDAEQLAVTLNTLPIMAVRRVIVLRDVHQLRKAARTVLDQYLTAPSTDTVLVMTAPVGATADSALAARSVSVPFPPLEPGAVPAWLTAQARKTGVDLAADAAALLADAVGTDLAHAAGELDKLASYTHGAPIDARAVEAIVGVRRGETLSDLLDAIAARDASRALPLIEPVLAQPKVSGVQIVMALTVQTLAMAWGSASRRDGMPASRMTQAYFGMLKSTGSYPWRPWNEAVSCWTKNASRWTHDDLQRAVAHLMAAELALKDTTVSSDADVLRTVVLALCARARAAA